MMGIEETLLSKILTTGDLRTPLKLGINRDTFMGASNNQVWDFIQEYYEAKETTGSVPSVQRTKSRFNEFEFEESPQKIHAICQELLELRLTARINQICMSAMNKSVGDPKNAFFKMREELLEIQDRVLETNDVTVVSGLDYVLDRYITTRDSDGVIGIPWPWPSLTEETCGIQEANFILFYGRQKTMKSWLMLWTAIYAYLQHNKRVLFFTWEMNPEEHMFRAASVFGAVDYEDWKKGRLTSEEEARVLENIVFLRDLEIYTKNDHSKRTIVFTSDRNCKFGGGIAALRSKIKEIRPDIVFVDGIYNMKDDRERKRSLRWRNQAHVIQDLHDIAKDLNLPVLASTQANRSGDDPLDENSRDVSFTDAARMYCDYMIKNYKFKIEGVHYLFVRIRASRDFAFEGFKLYAKPGLVIEQVAAYQTTEAMKKAIKEVKDQLESEEDDKKKKDTKVSVPDIARKYEWSRKKNM